MKKTLPAITSCLILSSISASAATLVAGWDTFSSGANSAPSQIASLTTADLSPGTGGNWSTWNNNDGASSDGTFGSLSTAIASASTDIASAGVNLSLNRSQKPGSLIFTLTNDSATNRTMDGFYFDGAARFTQSAKVWTLTFSGAISGTAATGTLNESGMMAAGAARNWAVDLTGLTDNVWEAGQAATFTLEFTGGATSDGSGGGQETLVDNIGITATIIPEPSTLSLLGLSGLSLLLRRRRS